MRGGQRKVNFFPLTRKHFWKWQVKTCFLVIENSENTYFIFFVCSNVPNFVFFFSPKTATIGGRSSFLSNFFWPATGHSHPHLPKFWMLLNSDLKKPAFENNSSSVLSNFFSRFSTDQNLKANSSTFFQFFPHRIAFPSSNQIIPNYNCEKWKKRVKKGQWRCWKKYGLMKKSLSIK